MNIIKKLFFSIVFFATSGLGYSFAQDFSCEDFLFSIEGPNNAVLHQTHNYTIQLQMQSKSGSTIDPRETAALSSYILEQAKINHRIVLDKRNTQNIQERSFYYAFPKNGPYTIDTEISIDRCKYTITKEITVFDQVLVYRGAYIPSLNFDMINNLKQQNRLLHTIISTEFPQHIETQLPYISGTSNMFINIDNYGLLFGFLDNLTAVYGIDLNDKHLFVISTENKDIVKKLLAGSIKKSQLTSVYVISPEEFEGILLRAGIGQDLYSDEFTETSRVGPAHGGRNYNFAQIVDYLIFHGFPVNTLGLLFSLTLAVLAIVFLKQVVGFSSFGVYHPLLFALSLHVLGLKSSIGMLLVAFISVGLVSFLLQKMLLLSSAKLALHIIAYIFLLVISLAIYQAFGLPQNDFAVFNNPATLIVSIVILLVAKKIWTSPTPFTTRKRRKETVRFAILAFGLYIVLSTKSIHYYLLLHPRLILLAAVLVIIIGRFLGLQLVEYLRFWPLVREKFKKQNK